VDCTVLAFDYPFEFSIITGILAGMGFNIHSGEVFTYRPVPQKPSRPRRKKKLSAKSASQDDSARRRIIDHFSGDLNTALSFQIWADECRNNMETIIGKSQSNHSGTVGQPPRRI
jgi:hypothetical protein